MTQNHQRFERNHQHASSQSHGGHRSPPGNAQDQRREFLWRERVRLELQVQALLARGESVAQQWQHLQERKAALGNQLPRVAAQMIIAGLVGMRQQLPAERLHLYKRERIAQEEYRLQQEIIHCQDEASGLYTQIEVLDSELSPVSCCTVLVAKRQTRVKEVCRSTNSQTKPPTSFLTSSLFENLMFVSRTFFYENRLERVRKGLTGQFVDQARGEERSCDSIEGEQSR